MSSRQDKRKVNLECQLCDALFYRRKDRTKHFKEPFHNFMKAIRQTQVSYMGNAKTLNEQITETGKKESLIGLEYIYEYAEDSNGVRMYECKLCDSGFQSDEIFFHIVGIEHRVSYLVKHHPIMGIEADFEVQNQANYRKLANHTLAIEQTHGRKKINVVNEVYVEKPKTYEDRDSETSSDGSSSSSSESRTKASRRSASPVTRDAHNRHNRSPQHTSRLRRERRARARLRLHEEQEFQQRDDSLSRERDRFLESRRDSLDMPRLPVLECGEDFDARYHDLRSGYLSDNRDIPEFQQDSLDGIPWQYGSGEGTAMLSDTRVGSSVQHGVAGIPPYQPERPFQPAATLQRIGKGPTPQDASEDVDLRWRLGGRGGPSVFSDVNRSSAAGDSRDQNRRRKRSPEPRNRSERYRSRFAGDCGDIDVRFMVPSGGISFRELKAAHERRLSEGLSSSHLPLSEKKQEKDNDSDMEVRSMEFSDCEPEEFWCNEELYDFLKSYHIGDEEGVQFILKAIKVMSEALVRHKTRKEDLQKWILEEKQKLELEKKVFSEIKKRKEDNIFATTMKKCVEPENIELFKQVTGEKDVVPSTAPAAQEAVQKPQETVKQPEQVTGFKRPPLLGDAPGAPLADQKPQAQKVDQPQPPPSFQKAQVPGIAPVVPGPQDLSITPAAQKVDEPPPLTNFQKALVSGSIAPLLQAAGRIPQAQKADEPSSLTSFQKVLLSCSIAPLLKAAGKLTQPQQVALTKKALVSGLGPLLQQLQRPSETVKQPEQVTGFKRPPLLGDAPGAQLAVQKPQAQKVDQPPPPPSFQKAQVPGIAPVVPGPQGAGAGSNLNQRMPGPRLDNPNPSKEQRPFPGQAAGGYSGAGAGSNLNQRMPGPRLDNPNPSKEQRPLLGQAAGRYSGAGAGSNLNQRMPGPRLDNPNPFKEQRPFPGQAAGGYSGHEMRFSQNPQIPGARFNDPDPSKQQRPSVGGQAAVRYPESGNPNQPQQQAVQRPPGSEARFNPSQGVPDSKIANPNPPRDQWMLAGQTAGRYAGPETRFNQNPQISGPRFDNPSPSMEQRPPIGQAAGRYSGPDRRYIQNQQFPGPWTDQSGSLNKTPLGAGSETRFTQNPQIPGSRSDNLNPSKAPRPPIGQAAGGYSGSDSRFNQNPHFPGSQMDNSGSLDKMKQPIGADLDAQYKQTQWNSGPQSGNQGFYNEARSATGMAAGIYGEQYTQNQWQPQFSSRGEFGSGVRPLGPQSQQPAGSAGISSDRHQDTLPNQDPPKRGVYPASILKNRTGNPP